jgi:hypothetical protein
VEPASTPSTKRTWRDSLPIDMLLSAVSVLVVAQSEIPEGLINNPVYVHICIRAMEDSCENPLFRNGMTGYYIYIF